MELPKNDICGYRAIEIRNLFRNFLQKESDITFVDGEFRHNPKRVDDAFVSTEFNIDAAEASKLIACLRVSGYLEADRNVPTPLAMALAAAKRRPRIPRSKAAALLQSVIDVATKINSRPEARVTIATIDVFGSYLSDCPDLGDLDLLVVFAMPKDMMPEDLEERDRVCSKLIKLSRYVSCHDELDPIAMSARKHRIFPS